MSSVSTRRFAIALTSMTSTCRRSRSLANSIFSRNESAKPPCSAGCFIVTSLIVIVLMSFSPFRL